MKYLCCCFKPGGSKEPDDEREPLLPEESQHAERRLQSPVRQDFSASGFENNKDSWSETEHATTTNSQSASVEIRQPGSKNQEGAKLDTRDEKEDEAGKEKAKVLEFKKFDIPELDCIFSDFKTTFDPFVENREEMSKAEDSFKKAVMSLGQISPRAKFSEYVAALKTRLKTEGITVKVKEGAATIYQEGKKTVKGISDAVAAVNAMLKLAKDLKAMPLTIASGSEDVVKRAGELGVLGILKREMKSMWDLGKIPKLWRAFSNNVKQVKSAPEMVREFYLKTKEIILEIYHAFADEEDQRKMEEELAEGDDTAKGEEKKEKGATGESDSNKKDKKEKDKKDKDNEEFHKKLEFESVGLDDIDNVFTSLASAINPFVETRERVQAARESFENIVKAICKLDAKKELKDYIKELKKDAKEGNITIYIDETDGEIKVKSIEGVKPPKLYRDAVQALRNLKSAGSETVELEPDVQHGIVECIERVTQIDPKRVFHSLLKKKSAAFTLPGKIKKFNDNRKKAQEIPGIVKEFCLYVKRLLTDILEALTGEKDADTADKKDEDNGKEGNKSSAGEDEPANKEDVVSEEDEDKSKQVEDGPVDKNDSGKAEEKVSAVFDELAIRNAAIKLEDDYEECVRVLPYLQDGEVEIHVYFYSDSSGMPTGLKNAAEALVGQKGWKLKEKNLYNDAFNLLKVTPIKYSSGKPKRLEASQVDEIDEIINEHLHDFCKHRNVTAVHPSFKVTNSEETQEACIAVYVLGKGKIPLGESPIPPTIGSYPVDIVNGFFVRTNDPYKPTKAHKQQEFLHLGASIGVKGKESSGTLGAIVEDVESGTFYALSCNHVLHDDDEKEIIHPGLDVYLNHVRYNLNNYKGEIAKVLGPTVELPQHSELETMFRDLKAIREQRVASLVPPVSDYTTNLMKTYEKNLEKAFSQQPRPIAKYLVGVTSNAIMTNGEEYFIDAAIAKLEEGEVQRVRAQSKVRIIDTPHYPSREYLQATAKVNNLFKSGSATGFTETNRLADEVYDKPTHIRGGGKAGRWIDVGCIPCNKGKKPAQSGRCEQCTPHGWFKRCLCIPDKGRKPFSGEGDSGAVIFEKHEGTLLSSGFAIIIGILDTQHHAFAIASSLQFALEELSRKVGEPCKLKLASDF